MNIIEAKSISKKFETNGKTVEILRDVNLSIEEGSFNVIMGPSGSGKTTFLSILGALDLPNSGTITINGENITSASEKVRERVRRNKLGFVFQSVALISNMSAYENIDYSLRISGFNAWQRKTRIIESLHCVGMDKKIDHKPFELSGGEQQRIAIARAIAHRPAILFADEPTSELDNITGVKVIELFKKLVREDNLTIIMCTHDTSIIEVADNVFELLDGVMVNDK